MTSNLQIQGCGLLLMQIAEYIRGRTPIASAVLANGLGESIHIQEYQDGECIVFFKDTKNPKYVFSEGKISSGSSAITKWESTQISLRELTEKFVNLGYKVTRNKRTDQLPLLQLPIQLAQKTA